MQKHIGWVTDTHGEAIPNVTVTVTMATSGNTAVIYSDDGTTAKANPFTVDTTDGSYFFYAANGRYTTTLSKTGYTFDSTDSSDVLLIDPDDPIVTTSSFEVQPGAQGSNVAFAFNSDVAGTVNLKISSKEANAVAQAAGGIGIHRNSSANTLVGIGWNTGDDATWDLDLGTAADAGGYDLNLNNKNIGARFLQGAGVGFEWRLGTGENAPPAMALNSSNQFLVGATGYLQSTIGNNEIEGLMALGHGRPLTWPNAALTAVGARIGAIDTGDITNTSVYALTYPTSGATSSKPLGFLFVLDGNSTGAVFLLQGGSNATIELLDPSTAYSATASTGSSTNIYYSAGNARYELENLSGGTVAYRLFFLTRT